MLEYQRLSSGTAIWNPWRVSGVLVRRGKEMWKTAAAFLLLVSFVCVGQEAPPKTARPHLVCTAGKVIKRVMRVYPKNVPAKALTDGVVIKLTIDKQGVPTDLKVTKGDPPLAKAALDAVRQWRWKPYKLNGEAVEVESSVYIRFEPARE